MSGGTFDYSQYELRGVMDQIRIFINENDSHDTDEYGDVVGRFYSKETLKHLEEAIYQIKKALVYINKIDLLYAADYDEQSFREELEDELIALCCEDKT